MASPATAYLEKPLRRLADELSNDLLTHMLECDRCLDPMEHACGIFNSFQSKIVAKGGATSSVAFAY
jgi:hypothetical protein